MDKLYIKNINKSFNNLEVLKDISLNFKEEEITCILGPSGCGKSTLLNIITGIITDYNGEVVGFNNKEISFIFQEDRLVPWLTVYDNIRLVLKDKYNEDQIHKRIHEYLYLTGIEDYMYYYPSSLSGGMKQRASIARALTFGGDLIIMDEPFKSLDIKSKLQILKDFKEIVQTAKSTVIFVTHDIDEAIEIGDSIYLLSDKPTYIKKAWNNLDQENLRNEILMNIMQESVD
ncbi:MAG: ABC transporter ATP-binding protein [Epulopiscium sp.]|nr:ABC transporter ATP-binding protein [Candidatus Epulonipiscium sp.]